jgi:hypothetical protein
MRRMAVNVHSLLRADRLKRRALLCALTTAVAAAVNPVRAIAQSSGESPRRFQDAKQWAGRGDDPNLPEPVDAALFVNVQGLMVNPGEYFARLRKSLKPGARVAILSTRLDSPTGARRDMRVSPEKVKIDMSRQGYALSAVHDFVATQFFLIFTPRS